MFTIINYIPAMISLERELEDDRELNVSWDISVNAADIALSLSSCVDSMVFAVLQFLCPHRLFTWLHTLELWMQRPIVASLLMPCCARKVSECSHCYIELSCRSG